MKDFFPSFNADDGLTLMKGAHSAKSVSRPNGFVMSVSQSIGAELCKNINTHIDDAKVIASYS